MMKWEYMYVNFNYSREYNTVTEDGKKGCYIMGSFEFLIEKLDEFGAMGWEISGGYSTYMLFKRPVS